MTRLEFQQLIARKVVILDGATGTELIKRGMGQGVSPEAWVVEHQSAACDIQNCYARSGSDIIYAPSFGGNRIKLGEFGLAGKTIEINRTIASFSKANLQSRAFVFGDIAPTGQFLLPYGTMRVEECLEIYQEQAQALFDGGVDGFVIETMMDVAEARLAVIAARSVSADLPILVTMTFDETMRTLAGNDPLSALVTLQALDIDGFGCNCSTGPEKMLEVIKLLKPYATIPLIAKPNAGLPHLHEGKTIFSMDPAEFAAFAPQLVAAGANIIGGCCGTTPDHIQAAAEAVRSLQGTPPLRKHLAAVSSPRHVTFLDRDQPFVVIGERINPTGKKALQAELREGKMNLVREFAADQSRLGAALLDVNMGLSGIDEKEMMLKAMETVMQASDLPLCIDSTNPEVIEAALLHYPGRALVNSVSAERNRLEKTLPAAAKFGAMFIMLPLTDEGIPETAEGRMNVVKTIYEEAQKYGYGKEDFLLDALIMTVSSDQNAAQVSLNLIEWATRQFGCGTTCGLSNISFGMPQRPWINAAFLGLAVGRGLSSAIANPANELLMSLAAASDVLTGRDRKMRRYVAKFGNDPVSPGISIEKNATIDPLKQVYNCVLEGDDNRIETALQNALNAGISPDTLVQEALIRGINQVGVFFEEKRYFLPQLILSADTMRKGFTYIEPLLITTEETQTEKTKVILATVEGDIHDIGKNIVGLMLKNYGFEVIDLGKDVAVAKIIAAIRKDNVKIVGLSALMTTTMTRMEEVIKMARTEGLTDVRFIIGGAVVDAEYAAEIHADAYAADAMESVRIAKKFVEEMQKKQ